MPKHIWKQGEITRLLLAIEQYGKVWDFLSNKLFPDVSGNGVRAMYYSVLK